MDRRAREGPLRSVPRSKGCINCVSRKSRCDGRRPTCLACESRKQRCRGYRRDEFVFMSDGWRAPGVASQLPADDTPRTVTQGQRRTCTKGRGTRQAPPASRQRPQKGTSASLTLHMDDLQDDDDTSSLVSLRPLTPEPMAVYVSFFLSQFTLDPPRTALVMIQNCRRYLGQLLERPFPGGDRSNSLASHPVTQAAEALVMTYFGRLHGSDWLIRESTHAYVRALKSLSAKLDEVRSVGIVPLEEDEWIHLVFSCLFLTFWELAMHPNGTTWQKHIRGLANLIEGRGPEGFCSPRSLELISLLRMFVMRQLLEAISSKRRSFLSRENWQHLRGFWPGSSQPVFQSFIQSAKILGPQHYLNYINHELVNVSNLAADFAELRDHEGAAPGFDTQSALSESLGILQRLETVLAHMQAEIGLVPSKPSLLRQPGQAGAAFITASSPSHSNRSTPLSVPVRPHSPDQPLKYNLASLCRTAAMTLRLLMCDFINNQQQQTGGTEDQHRLLLQEHRAALMVHAEVVLNSIPYSARSEIFDAAPMCFVPSFRMAEVILAREAGALRAERGRESEQLARCDDMRRLVRRHLEFVASRKIAVKIDV